MLFETVWAATALAAMSPAAGAAALLLADRTARTWSDAAPGRPGLVETLAAAAIAVLIVFAAMAAFRGPWAWAASALGLAFLYAGLIDLKVRLLPNWPTAAGALLGMAYAVAQDGLAGLGLAVCGATVGAAALALVRVAFSRWLRREALGLGDVKLAGAMGALLGPAAFWSALAAAAAATLAVAALARRDRAQALPFGPALLAAAWIGWAMSAGGGG